MIRVKTFDATGVAPNGRLYAVDVNAIQDAAAGITDLTQHLSIADLAIGESSLLLSRYGVGQAQLAGLLRIASGMLPGTFTTTQRDAIAAGKRPTGLVIFNSTTNQAEINVGTDAVPVWVSLGGEPSGTIKMFGGVSTVPTGYLPCDGAIISRTTYAALFAAIGTNYGAGDGSTTFGIPDMRGRMAVGLGTHADVNALNANDGLAVGVRRPRHKHSVGDPGHTHAAPSGGSLGTSNQPAQSAGGGTGVVTGSSVTGITVGPQTGNEPTDSAAYQVVNFIIKT